MRIVMIFLIKYDALYRQAGAQDGWLPSYNSSIFFRPTGVLISSGFLLFSMRLLYRKPHRVLLIISNHKNHNNLRSIKN